MLPLCGLCIAINKKCSLVTIQKQLSSGCYQLWPFQTCCGSCLTHLQAGHPFYISFVSHTPLASPFSGLCWYDEQVDGLGNLYPTHHSLVYQQKTIFFYWVHPHMPLCPYISWQVSLWCLNQIIHCLEWINHVSVPQLHPQEHTTTPHKAHGWWVWRITGMDVHVLPRVLLFCSPRKFRQIPGISGILRDTRFNVLCTPKGPTPILM